MRKDALRLAIVFLPTVAWIVAGPAGMGFA